MRFVLAILILAGCHPSSSCGVKNIVHVDPSTIALDSGSIHGTVAADGSRAFLGIPFATPPVGARRWMPPAAVERWPAVREATARGHACVQLDGDTMRADSDEDCLTLQVWTPPGDGFGLPVMVWIPGGAFIEGGGGLGLYDGAKLAARAHAIVVTLNYRVGAFGFLALPGQPHPSLGLLDQQAALRWVHRNIAAFGGDPMVVTIFGESAGAWSVCAHLVMPGSRWLFSRAIMESGACADPLYFDRATADAQGRALTAALDCTDLACLRGKSAEAVLRALPGRRGYILPPGAWWGPVIDDDLPAQPLELLRAGKGANVPLLIGWNRDEGTLHTIRFSKVEPGELAQFVGEGWGARAPEPMIANHAGATPKDTLTDLITDGAFACEARRVARVLTAQHVPVFAYEWTHPLDDPQAHHLGATHSVELWFVFGHGDMGVELSAAEHPLADIVMDAWGAFARRGDPKTPALPWPAYDAGKDELVVLDTTPSVAAHVKADSCDRWDAVSAH